MNISALAATVNPRMLISIFFSIVIILVYIGIPVLVISLMIRLFRYLKTAGNERKLLRIELGKLAEEVQQLRRELKGTKEQDSSAKTE